MKPRISPFKSLYALLYDLFPLFGIYIITTVTVILVRKGQDIKPGALWFQLLLLAETMLYFIHSWKKGGQTLGMRAWKIRLPQPGQLSWPQALARFGVGALSTALLGLGLWWQYIDKQGRSWMHMAGGQALTDDGRRAQRD